MRRPYQQPSCRFDRREKSVFPLPGKRLLPVVEVTALFGSNDRVANGWFQRFQLDRQFRPGRRFQR
jgi:hypothetical protein